MTVTREFLKNLSIEGDALEKIMTEVGKDKAISAEKVDLQKQIDDLTSQNDSLQTQISDRDKQLGELKHSVGDNDELKAKIKKLQDSNKEDTEQYQHKLATQSKAFKIDTALRDANARNPKTVKALLDLEKVSVDGENLVGLNNQLENIKKTDAYLFDDGKPAPKPPIKVTQTGNPSSGDGKPKPFSEMSYSEMVAAAENNPELLK